MNKITAANVRPGDTFKTSGTAEAEPVTLTVVDGGWTDLDEFGNWVEPKGERSTHVFLHGEDEDADVVLLPVDELVWLVRRETTVTPV